MNLFTSARLRSKNPIRGAFDSSISVHQREGGREGAKEGERKSARKSERANDLSPQTNHGGVGVYTHRRVQSLSSDLLLDAIHSAMIVNIKCYCSLTGTSDMTTHRLTLVGLVLIKP